MTTPIDQLIGLCQAYLGVASHPSRSSAFIEWVIQIADGSATPSSDRIETKFLVARIWGAEELLDQIKAKLDSITSGTIPNEFIPSEESEEDEVKVEESSANINNHLLVEVKIGTPLSDISRYHVVPGGYVISGSLDSRESIRPRIDQLKVVNARNVAHILKEEIGWMGKINDLIPSNLLIHLFNEIYLWKGSEGILINNYSITQYYFGHLTSNCRSITINNTTELPSLNEEHKSKYTDQFNDYITNNYQQLVKIVKENVSNPNYFTEVITYTVKIVQSLTPSVSSSWSLPLGYQNCLEIIPSVDDSVKVDKVRTEVNNKSNSFDMLVEKVTKILNN